MTVVLLLVVLASVVVGRYIAEVRRSNWLADQLEADERAFQKAMGPWDFPTEGRG